MPAAAEDGFADYRGADDLAVEHDGEADADVLAGGVGEALAARGIEAEGDHRLIVPRIKGRLGVDQGVAADHDPFADQVHAGAAVGQELVGRGQEFGTRRHPPGQGIGKGRLLVHQMEGHLGGLAEQALHPLRIVDAGKLHQDAVVALTLDGGFAHARFIDAPAHDLDRLFDRRRTPVADGLVGEAEGDAPAVAELGLGRLRVYLAHQLARLLGAGRVPDGDGDGVALDAQAPIADTRLAQGARARTRRGRESPSTWRNRPWGSARPVTCLCRRTGP